jgi:hypothetical protein
MSPLNFLALIAAIPVLATVWQVIAQRRRRRLVYQLARQWRMHYSPNDRFRLAERMADHFPMVGAADLLVHDVIYGLQHEHYRYVFTIDYTEGVVRTKRRRSRVVAFAEPRERLPAAPATALKLAAESGSLREQYEDAARAFA